MPSGAREPVPGDGGGGGRRRGPVAAFVARELDAARGTLRSGAALARRLWATRPAAARGGAIAFAAACAVASALSVLAQASLPGRLPSPRDWAALRVLLEQESRPGDAVAVAPAWAERAREIAPGNVPVLAQPRYAGEDLAGVRRVWLVALPEAPGFSWAPELDLVERAPRAAPAERMGALEVSRLDVTFPLLPLAFLPDRLAGAEVSHGGEPCAPDGELSFRCPGEGAPRVAREVREVGGAPRPCLVVTAGVAPVAIAFPPVRIGRVLRGHAGAPGDGGGATGPVRVSVVVEGEEAGSAEISGAGFVPFEVDTTRFGGFPRPVSLVVTLPGGAGSLCLDAALLP